MSDSLPLALIAGFSLLVAIYLIVAALTAKDDSEGRQTLMRVMRDAGHTRVIDDKSSIRVRILDPILARLQRIGWRLTPAGRIEKLEKRVEAAGFPVGWDLTQVVLLKVLFAILGAALGVLLMLLFGFGFGLILTAVLTVAGFFMPDYILDKRAGARTNEMRRALADTVDILKLTLEAGVGFDSAMQMVARNTDGPLAEEFGRVVQEITIGKSRAEALYALAERTADEDLRRFCQTCAQAEKRGTPLGEVLEIQSEELRIKRRQIAEESAQKVPVKILFPMMGCILPVLMMVVIGPAIIMIMKTGLGMIVGGR